MHGRAKDLVETDADPRFVISERNYLELHEENQALYARLKNELFCANLIVIIGYSMRDLEVARMLIDGGHTFRSKTIIVCNPNDGQMAKARLAKFGEVLPIGVDGLAAELNDVKPSADPAAANNYQFVDIVEPVSPAASIEGEDFVKLILTGAFSREKYQAQLQQAPGAPEMYCVRRGGALDAVIKRPASGVSRFLVSSDLGNGKSIFLDELAEELLAGGYRVVRIATNMDEVFGEIDRALGSRQQVAFLIDDVIRYRKVAQYIGARLNALALLVCCLRGDPGEVASKDLTNSLGGAVRQIDLNHLTLDELRAWDVALERWGLWEQRISLDPDKRLAFLSEQCSAENQSVVLSLFRTSQIAAKINQIVTFFLRDRNHQRAFAALLTSSLCQRHVEWESLVSWLRLDEDQLRRDINDSEIGPCSSTAGGGIYLPRRSSPNTSSGPNMSQLIAIRWLMCSRRSCCAPLRAPATAISDRYFAKI